MSLGLSFLQAFALSLFNPAISLLAALPPVLLEVFASRGAQATIGSSESRGNPAETIREKRPALESHDSWKLLFIASALLFFLDKGDQVNNFREIRTICPGDKLRTKEIQWPTKEHMEEF